MASMRHPMLATRRLCGALGQSRTHAACLSAGSFSSRLVHAPAAANGSSSSLSSGTNTKANGRTRANAIAQGPPFNFSFSGSGFLISYHLGVAKSLMQMQLLQFDNDSKASKVAGGSGGSLTALALACDFDLDEMHDDTKRMVRLCHQHGTVWKLEKRLREIFDQKRPQISLDKINQRLSITTTKWLPPPVKIVHHDHFETIDEVVDACVASCWVPYYLAPQMTTSFKGQQHLDGTILELVPELPGYIKVCAFPAHVLRRQDYAISPSVHPKFPFSIVQLARYSLFPPSLEIQDDIFRLGQESASIWASQEHYVLQRQQTQETKQTIRVHG